MTFVGLVLNYDDNHHSGAGMRDMFLSCMKRDLGMSGTTAFPGTCQGWVKSSQINVEGTDK